jgi:HK97 family phage major capsid protein
LTGFLNRAGLSATQARGADSNADAILKQIAAIQAAVWIRPDAVVMNPANWTTLLLLKDASGRPFGDSPFSMLSASSLWGVPTMAATIPSLWGLPVVISPQIPAGTALVGRVQNAIDALQARRFESGKYKQPCVVFPNEYRGYDG